MKNLILILLVVSISTPAKSQESFMWGQQNADTTYYIQFNHPVLPYASFPFSLTEYKMSFQGDTIEFGGFKTTNIEQLLWRSTISDVNLNTAGYLTFSDTSVLATKIYFSANHTWNNLIGKPSFFSGNYNDLVNKPTLFDGDYFSLTNRPSLFSGAYADLTGKPSLFSGSYTDLTNKPAIKRQELYSGITNASGIYAVTFTESYSIAPNIQVTAKGLTSLQFINDVQVTTTGFSVHAYSRSVVSSLPIIGGVDLLSGSITNLLGLNIDVIVTEK